MTRDGFSAPERRVPDLLPGRSSLDACLPQISALQRFEWQVRRMEARNLWRRLIAPWKRRKRQAAAAASAQGFEKADGAQRTNGPALVFADLGGSHGLSCAAVYDLVTIRAQHGFVQVVDIGPVSYTHLTLPTNREV